LSVAGLLADDQQTGLLAVPSVPIASRVGGDTPVKPEGAGFFQQGVKEYIDRNDEAAIGSLKKALEANGGDEKAQRLLLKVYFRAIHDQFEKRNYRRAWEYVEEAKRYFPFDSELSALSDSVRKAVPPPAAPPPAPAPPKAAPRAATGPAVVRTAPASVPSPAPAPAPSSSREKAEETKGRYVSLGVILFLGVAVLLQKNRQKALETEMKSVREKLNRLDTERAALQAKSETQSDMLRRMEATHKEELERLMRRFDRGLEQEAAPVPGKTEGPAGKQRGTLLEQMFLHRREQEIRDVLVDVTPPEREVEAGRISAQVRNLYETAPREALRFLRGLSKDANPTTRLLIVPALAETGDPAAVDVLFELERDESPEVQREVLKHLKKLRNDGTGLPEECRRRIAEILEEEKSKADWVF